MPRPARTAFAQGKKEASIPQGPKGRLNHCSFTISSYELRVLSTESLP